MQHRHLNHERFTPAAVDDIILRGGQNDWIELRDQLRRDPALADLIRRLCEPQVHDLYAQRYHFWLNYVNRRTA